MKIFCLSNLLLVVAETVRAAPKLVSRTLPPDAKFLENPNGLIQKELSRIVGGTESPDGAYPWFGRTDIRINENGVPRFRGSCGASLIHPLVAISAFHCIEDNLQPNLEVVSITIFFGANEFDGSDSVSTRSVESFFYFPDDYDFPFFDMVLYILNEPVTNIDPIAFNRDCNLPTIGNMAKVIGFGRLTEGGPAPSRLMEVEVEVQPASFCNNFFSGDDISESELICTFTEGKGTCQGDSGGPIVATVNGELTTFGVTSFGGVCGEAPNGLIATSHYESSLIKAVICNELGGTPPAYCTEEVPVCDFDSESGCGDFFFGLLCPFKFIWDLITAIFELLFGWL